LCKHHVQYTFTLDLKCGFSFSIHCFKQTLLNKLPQPLEEQLKLFKQTDNWYSLLLLLCVCVDRLHMVLVNTGVISCWLMYVKPSYLPMTVADFESLCVLTGLIYVQSPGEKSGLSLYLNVPGVVYSRIVSTTYVMAVIVAMW
jgi:hypothetical protein